MKVFWISLTLFFLLLTAIFWNIHYIHENEQYLTELVTSLEEVEGREEKLDELESFWEKHRDFFGLSVSFREIDHFGEVLVELRWAHDFSLEAEFQKYRAMLLDAIEEITRNEKISLGNIF